MRFLFFYLMTSDAERVREVAPSHAAYWQALALPGYLGGPFADRSGGSLTFESDTAGAAEQLVRDDPFFRERLLSRWWLQQWLAEPAPSTTPRSGHP